MDNYKRILTIECSICIYKIRPQRILSGTCHPALDTWFKVNLSLTRLGVGRFTSVLTPADPYSGVNELITICFGGSLTISVTLVKHSRSTEGHLQITGF